MTFRFIMARNADDWRMIRGEEGLASHVVFERDNDFWECNCLFVENKANIWIANGSEKKVSKRN